MRGLSGIAREIDRKRKEANEAVRRAECTNEINDIYSTINKNQEEYDKQLLTLSSGYLLLSLAFIKDIVPTPQAIHKSLLYSSFVVLSLCVLSVLTSYQVSNEGLDRAKLYWEDQRDGEGKVPFPDGFAQSVKWLNRINGLIFFSGICLSMSFVITNLQNEAKMSPKSVELREAAQLKSPSSGDWAQKGASIKAPPSPRPTPPPPPSPPPPPPKK